MSTIFMKLGDHKIKGGATAEIQGAGDGAGDNWFAINSVAWRAERGVGMQVGNEKNQDTGMSTIGAVSVHKVMDAASEVLLSRMFVPGTEGDKTEIIFTKPDRAGKGVIVSLLIRLEHTRICDYNVNAMAGTDPYETLVLAFTQITFKHWNEEEGGELIAGGDVTFDVATGKATSHCIQNV